MVKYPKPKYGTISPSTVRRKESGERWEYKGFAIYEGEAYYSFDQPINDSFGQTRDCWVVTRNKETFMVKDGNKDAVRKELGAECDSSSSSEEAFGTSRRTSRTSFRRITMKRRKQWQKP